MTLINHDKLTTHSFTTTEAYRPLTDSVEKMDPILPFPDIYISQVARQGPSFADVFKETLDSTDPEGLEALREMDSRRNTTCCLSDRGEASPDFVDRLTAYIKSIKTLIDDQRKARLPSVEQTQFTWSSSLGRNSTYKCVGLQQELVQAMFLLGGSLIELAVQVANTYCTPEVQAAAPAAAGYAPGAAEDGPGQLAEALTMLRRAAGAYDALRLDLCHRVQPTLTSDRAPEFLVVTSEVMCKVALGLGHAVMALRAVQKGSSPNIAATLYVTASTMFEEASKTYREQQQGDVNERLRRYLAVSGGLHKASALKQYAEHLRKSGQAGQAEAACKEAAAVLQTCKFACDVATAWIPHIVAQEAALEAVRLLCEKDRVNVYYQGLASSCPKLPDGRNIVKPLEFS